MSQQTLQSYEVGRRRIPVSALPVVARMLPMSLEGFFGRDGAHVAAADRGDRAATQGQAALRQPDAGDRAGPALSSTINDAALTNLSWGDWGGKGFLF